MTQPIKLNLSARRKARRYALQALYQWEISASEPAAIAAEFYAYQPMEKVDGEYFQTVLFAVPKMAEQLDALMEPHLGRPFKNLNPIEKTILRIGLFELTERPEIPYKVVINEALELAKTFGGSDSYKFANGALNSAAKALRAAEYHAGQ